MKAILWSAVIVRLLATSCWAGSNLNLSKSNINRISQRGTFVTANADITGAVSRIVYTVPTNQDFLLTQACAGPAEGGVLIEVGGVGIAQVGSGLCQTFNPGVILTSEQLLVCTSFAAAQNSFCMISGILGPVNPTPTPRP